MSDNLDMDNSNEFNCNEWLFALQQKNLVYNYNFLYFSNKTTQSSITEYHHPDGWIYNDSGTGGQISLDGESCRIVTGTGGNSAMTFRQALNEFPRAATILNGNRVTARAVMTVSQNTQINIILSDGISSTVKNTHMSTDGNVDITLSLDIAKNAEELYIEIQSPSQASTITISKVFANIGTIAIESLPCMVNGVIGERKQYIATENSPAEELSLCRGVTELGLNQTRLSSVLNHRFGTGSNNLSLLPDVRGYFSRSWDNGANVDTDASTRKMAGNESIIGDRVGTLEVDAFMSHDHPLNFAPVVVTQGTSATATALNTTASSTTKETGGSETRPKNIAELFTIKWA